MKNTVLFHLTLCLVTALIPAHSSTAITARPGPSVVLDSPEFPPYEVIFSGVTFDESQLQTYRIGEKQTHQVKEKVLEHVEPAIWRGGCVPTTTYMYWKALYNSGFTRIFGSLPNPHLAPTERTTHLIASAEHYRDYFNPDDTEGPLQADRSGWISRHSDGMFYNYTALYARYPNSIADLFGSSMALYGLRQGATFSGEHLEGTVAWIKNNIPTYDVTGFMYYFEDKTFHYQNFALDYWNYQNERGDHLYAVTQQGLSDPNIPVDPWAHYVNAIDQGRPVYIPTNSRAGGGVDHASLGIGYRQTSDGKRYWAAYNTWATTLQWYEFRKIELNTGPAFGIGGVVDLIVSEKEGPTENHFKPATVHRFFNPGSKAYFFTANPAEAAEVYDHNPAWIYQGQSMQIEVANTNGTTPVYRFYNTISQSHFYTASSQERDGVIQNLPHVYHYEGVAFYVRTNPDASKKDQPVHRFYIPATASHFFTAIEAEAEHLKRYANPNHMQYEGVAWYAPLGEYYHTGIQYHFNAPELLAAGEYWIWAPYMAAGTIDYE